MDGLLEGKEKMKTFKELQKEKNALERQRNKCYEYALLLQNKLGELNQRYYEGKISPREYHEKATFGLAGKSFEHYFSLYQAHIGRYERRLGEIKKEQGRKKRGMALSLAIILLLLIPSLLLTYQGSITGNIVYSVTKSNVDSVNLVFNESKEVIWYPVSKGRLNTLAITGKYEGNATAKVYLVLENGVSKLLYASDSAAEFVSECGSACYLHDSSQENYGIRVELQDKNSKLAISQIEYHLSRLEEFTLSPNNLSVALNDTRFIKNRFGIYNSQRKNITLAVYAEGELAKHMTLYSSKEALSENDSVRFVTYEIDLPVSQKSGTYKGKVVVRYIPEGRFTGEAPKEEHEVTVKLSQKMDMASPKESSYLLFLGISLLLVIGINIAVFFLRKNKR